MPGKVVVHKYGPDIFRLGISWSADLTFGINIYNVKSDRRLGTHASGDGKSNDQPAIQAAIKAAAEDGGGVVYLPPGTYKLQADSGPLLLFKSRVVVQGAGQAQSKIVYGFGEPSRNAGVAIFSNVSQCGLCDLSMLNMDSSKLMQTFGVHLDVTLTDRSRYTLLYMGHVH